MPPPVATCDRCGRASPDRHRRADGRAYRCRPCRREEPLPYGSRGSRAPHGTPARYDYGCRCAECTAAVRQYQRERRARHAASGRPVSAQRRREQRACKVCGAKFTVRADSSSAMCSMRCVGIDKRKDPAAPVKERRPGVVRTERLRRQAERSRRGTAGSGFVAGQCPTCGANFVSRRKSARYCSDACVPKGNGWKVSDTVRTEVYTRDAYVCQICGSPTDPTAGYLDDQYPSLDHIIPRSKGGTHGADNLRTAHRLCNSLRGDETYVTDADIRALAAS